ncbi:acyl-CoA thioesterase [Micrococcus sp.]|uniref:acyl-CoA thioesterase n=1 Tax=Micrococcus sp. TaxID=1271 RepID=UPI002A91C7D4|nr:acyl-CoA thioesterase [Micrococcus sp.]MDY6055024.1 acyl-CoA thioesterase [Micrococcus sp.]
MNRTGSLSLDIRADHFDHPSGLVDAGTVVGWIDKVGYAVAASWSGTYVRARYIGTMQFSHPVPVDTRVTVQGRVVRTHGSSIHVQTRVLLPELLDDDGAPLVATASITVYGAEVGGQPRDVPAWMPSTAGQVERDRQARRSSVARRTVERAMNRLPFPEPGEQHEEMTTLSFLAPAAEATAGGTVSAGVVLRWLDEAAGVCAARWTGEENVVAVFAGGVRLDRPVHVGDLVRVDALLVNTTDRSMHVALRVHAGPRSSRHPERVAHSIAVMVARGEDGHAEPVRPWTPAGPEARQLQAAAMDLVRLRSQVGAAWTSVPPTVRGRDGRDGPQ